MARIAARFVAALDIGTTFSGAAWSTVGEGPNPDVSIYEPHEWPDQNKCFFNYSKAPTSLIYDRNGQLAHFGYAAELRKLESPGLYIRRFKMFLAYDREESARQWSEARLLPDLQRPKTLVQVLADYLTCLKDFTLEKMSEQYGLSSGEILQTTQWCLTVPAIWENHAKAEMVKAAQMAGIVQGPHAPVAGMGSPLPIKIVLEPEAGSLFCFLTSDEINSHLQPGDQVMIGDFGGGTFDSVIHAMASAQEFAAGKFVREVLPGVGNDCGGAKVDDAFQRHVEQLIPNWSSFVNEPNNATTVIKLMANWESVKRAFVGNEETIIVGVPSRLRTFWQRQLGTSDDGDDDDEDDLAIRLTTDEMKSFFDPILDGIVDLMRVQLDNAPLVHTLILIGGFSESPYVRRRINDAFSTQYRVFTPIKPGTAVVKGAVWLGLRPLAVFERCVRRSYAVASARPSQPGDPDEAKFMHQDKQISYTNSLDIFVAAGQKVPLDHVVARTYLPLYANQTAMKVVVFSSTDPQLKYPTQNPRKECTIVIETPDVQNGLDRPINVAMYFGDSTIRVVTTNKRTGQEYNHELTFE